MVISMRSVLWSVGVLVLSFTAATAMAQAPVGEVFAADASIRGTVLYAGSGTKVLSGSQVSAGGRPAVLKLTRGGEIRICPNTSVAVAASPNGRNLLFSLNSGDVEFHFDVRSNGDALQTPDFRVQFIGPAHFDLAMCSDKHGNLSLRGNNNRAAIIVSEMMGDGVYQVSAGDSIDFRNGTVANPEPSTAACGCPEPSIEAPPVVLAQELPPPPTPVAPPPPAPSTEEHSSAPTPAPVSRPVETHVQLDAPFIFRGVDPVPEMEEDILARMQTVSVMDLNSRLQPTVTVAANPPAPPPPTTQATQPQKKRGFFRKLGSFFGKIFKG